ncbi:MAG: hypothetical protein AB7O97_18025 [Planctomycetota bacterium]
MSTHPVSTAEVVALRSLRRSAGQAFVDWAVGMLTDGHDTPGLRVLAGESPPFQPFAMEALVDRVLAELGLALHPTPRAAARALATARIAQAVAGRSLRSEVLAELAQLHTDLGYDTDLGDFYLLHHARTDLLEGHMQWYWDADRDTIDAIVEERFRAWLQEQPNA